MLCILLYKRVNRSGAVLRRAAFDQDLLMVSKAIDEHSL